MPTNETPSEWEQVLSALDAKLRQALPTTQVKLRRRPQMVQGDQMPLVVIAPRESGETLELATFCKEVTWSYPVHVGAFMAANRQLDLDFQWLNFRQKLRDLVFAPFQLSNGQMVDWEIETDGPFLQLGEEQNLQTTVFQVIYKVGSTRG